MKICVIGGGSTYSPELLEGLLERRHALGLEVIHLHDVDQSRLEVVGGLAQRMCARAGGDVEVRLGTDRLAAIEGSSFVVSQIRVGGMAARARDEELGREFGLVGQETVGIGGLANALRTIPVALDIATDIERAAPAATLLNFTNPAGLVTEALSRHAAVRTIGLCNIPWTVRARLAARLGVEPSTVELESVGLNHLTWIRRVRVAGEDRTAEVLAHAIRAAELRRADAVGSIADATDEPRWTADELRDLQAIPNPYLRYFHHTERWVERQRIVPTRAAEVARIEQALLTQYADPALEGKPPELAHRGGAFYSEAATELMVDLVAGRGAIHVVNTMNRGAIPGLPDDIVVEVAAEIGAGAVRPLPVTPLRRDVADLILAVKASELLAIEAAVHGDHDAAVRSLSAHPLGPSSASAPAVWARLVELNRGWLGRLG